MSESEAAVDVNGNAKYEGLTVTIKYKGDDGKGFDQPWAVFHGSVPSIRALLIDYFGLTAEEHEGLPLHAVVLNAQRYAHGLRSLQSTLGGTVTAVKTGEGWGKEDQGQDAWSQVPSGATQTPVQAEPVPPVENPYAELVEKLTEAADIPTLKRLWAENRPAFSADTNPHFYKEVQTAYGSRGKAINAAKAAK